MVLFQVAVDEHFLLLMLFQVAVDGYFFVGVDVAVVNRCFKLLFMLLLLLAVDCC